MLSTSVIENRTEFQAAWPKSLDPAFETTLSKIKKYLWNFLSIVIFPIGLIRLAGSWLRNITFRISIPGKPEIDVPIDGIWSLAKIIARFIYNPENFKANLEAEGEELLQKFSGYALHLTAPDQAKLHGAFFSGKHRKKVIVYAGGNAQQWEDYKDVLKNLQPLNTSILLLNSRGVGKSSGSRYEDGYALDFYTAYEYLIHEHQIDPEDIVAVGFSMGAATTTLGASLIQEKYPDKKISAINMCSFSDLLLEIKTVLNEGFFAFVGRTAAQALSIKMNVKAAWDKLQGEKCIFYKSEDPVIPEPASLFRAVTNHPIGKTKVIQLKHDKGWNNHYLNNGDYSVLREEILRILKIPRQFSLRFPFWNPRGSSPSPLDVKNLEQVV